MKIKALLFLFVMFFGSFAYTDSDFCEGYYRGYREGYCYHEFSCLEPLKPLCPIQSLDDADTYKAGFERGFADGLRDK